MLIQHDKVENAIVFLSLISRKNLLYGSTSHSVNAMDE